MKARRKNALHVCDVQISCLSSINALSVHFQDRSGFTRSFSNAALNSYLFKYKFYFRYVGWLTQRLAISLECKMVILEEDFQECRLGKHTGLQHPSTTKMGHACVSRQNWGANAIFRHPYSVSGGKASPQPIPGIHLRPIGPASGQRQQKRRLNLLRSSRPSRSSRQSSLRTKKIRPGCGTHTPSL